MFTIGEDINRFVDDLYEIVYYVKINGNIIDCTEYDVYFQYKEYDDTSDDYYVSIKGVFVDEKNGLVVFYPRKQYCKKIYEDGDSDDYVPFKIIGNFKYRIIRTKNECVRYDKGDWQYDSDGNCKDYDSDDDSQRYDKQKWKMTHQIGTLNIIQQ